MLNLTSRQPQSSIRFGPKPIFVETRLVATAQLQYQTILCKPKSLSFRPP